MFTVWRLSSLNGECCANNESLRIIMLYVVEQGKSKIFVLFVCLGCIVPLENFFYEYGDVIITDERLQILTYAWPLWPRSSEGSLAVHTYCDTGHPPTAPPPR